MILNDDCVIDLVSKDIILRYIYINIINMLRKKRTSGQCVYYLDIIHRLSDVDG